MLLSEIIENCLKENHWTAKELARRAGLTPTYVGLLKKGEYSNPSAKALEGLATAMGMTTGELTAKLKDQTYTKIEKKKLVGYEFIPMFSGLSCGTGKLVEEEAENFIPVPEEWINRGKTYFANRADGDSMTGREIHPQDVLIFERTDVLENGDVGSFCLNGENLCKTFHRVSDDTVFLESANPKYSPIYVNLKEDNDFRVIGKLAYQIVKR